MAEKRTIFVDVSIIARRDAGTGIQRVVRAIWNELTQLPQSAFDIVPIAGSAKRRYRRIPKTFLSEPVRKLPLAIGKARVRPKSGDWFLGLDLSSNVIPRNSRQLMRWKAKGVQIGVVVYDLLPMQRPDWFSVNVQTSYARWLDTLAGLADCLLCISSTVAGDMSAWLLGHAQNRSSEPSVTAIRIGGLIASSTPTRGRPGNAEDILRWVRSGCTIMMVGTIEPRKGYDQAVSAFERLWDKDRTTQYQLLVIGRSGWKTEELQHSLARLEREQTRFRWLSDVSDEFLEELYDACAGLLMASRGEGYGLPLLEAAVYGKPILARDIPIFREVAPTGTVFFSGNDAADLEQAVVKWSDGGERAKTTLVQAHWHQTLKDIMEAMQN